MREAIREVISEAIREVISEVIKDVINCSKRTPLPMRRVIRVGNQRRHQTVPHGRHAQCDASSE